MSVQKSIFIGKLPAENTISHEKLILQERFIKGSGENSCNCTMSTVSITSLQNLKKLQPVHQIKSKQNNFPFIIGGQNANFADIPSASSCYLLCKYRSKVLDIAKNSYFITLYVTCCTNFRVFGPRH